MTDDQHRAGQLTKAQLLIADTLERFATEPRDPAAVATWLTEQLQGYGWRLPLDPTHVPPLRPAHPVVGDDTPGRREFAEARAQLAARRNTPAQTIHQP